MTGIIVITATWTKEAGTASIVSASGYGRLIHRYEAAPAQESNESSSSQKKSVSLAKGALSSGIAKDRFVLATRQRWMFPATA
ncbi:MAG: hypothetical protein CMP47_06715 [Rickettsiales bacterium]|nr:hypothetical protein [Rickettsiales bacterium]